MTMSRGRLLRSLVWNAARDRPQNKWMVNLAITLVMVPAFMLFPLTIQFFVDPLWIWQSWENLGVFLIFYGAPWCLAGILIYAAATVGEPVKTAE